MNKYYILFFCFVIVLCTSCSRYNPSIMFEAEKDYEYSELKDSVSSEYTLEINDIVSFKIYSKEGYKLVDVSSLSKEEFNRDLEEKSLYTIEVNGSLNLPVVGRVEVVGLSVREAREKLIEKYSEFYINPFISLSVKNRRAIVFTGENKAKVVPLVNENMTLIEVIGLAGGLEKKSKAYNIKVIRDIHTDVAEVYRIDLSTIKGVQQAGMKIQANDVVYVEPRKTIFGDFFQEISPVLSVATSTLSILISIQILNNQ